MAVVAVPRGGDVHLWRVLVVRSDPDYGAVSCALDCLEAHDRACRAHASMLGWVPASSTTG